ncbi:piggyBac transposable element-derived protein 4-like [Penaeus chinensis]|uniref:piggyBac transposable element-derived protein 4-like n=1 Tax=Penaeus chinensis TaxID=139456 RepID=UPI001FB716AF|nr:piggyBac transposable element-derived protein 4-like [Penaeus chinensis]
MTVYRNLNACTPVVGDSEESDESRDTEDNGTDEAEREREDDGGNKAGETEDGDSSPASSLAPVQGRGPVSSKQRSYIFSGKEELVILPQVKSVTGKQESIEVYKSFITDALLNTIVTQTNTFAQQKINAAPVTRRSRFILWKSTAKEMKKFIGVIIYMGIIGMLEISSHWSKNKLYADSYVSNAITRERFEILLKCIHFKDNIDIDNLLDPLFKLKPLATAIRDQCQAVYKPGPMFVIDESMIPFRGRVKVKQYLSGKAHKYGFRLYRICTLSSYTWNFKINSGCQKKYQELNATESLTVELCEELLDQGGTLYAENYYCLVTLADDVIVTSSKKNRSKEDVFKPESVMVNSKAKEVVDISDQYTSSYSPLRKSKI